MTDIIIYDLENGDVFVNFGEVYAHIYSKEERPQIKKDISAYQDGADLSLWDNNEIDEWNPLYNTDWKHQLTLADLQEPEHTIDL